MSVHVIVIRSRADRDEQFLPVWRELQIACPVTTTGRQIGNVLSPPGGFQIAVMIRKSHHGVGLADVYPLRVGTRRIKRDSVRPSQTGGEDGHLFRFAIARDSAE